MKLQVIQGEALQCEASCAGYGIQLQERGSADRDPFMELIPESQTDDIIDLDDASGESSLEKWENFGEMKMQVQREKCSGVSG